ncbi:hypothetical protein BJV74DRAFT_503144 [Russula compacta]|nr:hypothetical protein BJV74DRAFT_503144 [Russula compacta]
MFKRVDRRRKRREEQESLDLDEDEREVLGLHDTDSSESESDSSESTSASSSSGTSSDGHGTQSGNKRKRGTSPFPYNESGVGELATDDEEDEDESSDRGANPPLTIASALQEPIRLIRPHPEAWTCALCPGKILKHMAMVKVHEDSRIHRRRSKRIRELAMEFSPDEDIQNVLAKSATEAQSKADGTTSHRAAARKAKNAKFKERRNKIKEKKVAAIAMAKAKKATKTETMAGPLSGMDEATQAPKRLKIASSDPSGTIKNIDPASPRAGARKILTKAGRKSRYTAKIPVHSKSKRRPETNDEATFA